MSLNHVKTFLDEHQIRYVTISHSPAYTAQEIAACAHMPGREVAKSVIVKLDDELAMVVMPAPMKVDLELLRHATGARDVALADENEFVDHFPDCEAGAMPPLGNLYGMKVYVAESLADDELIAFNAGSHTELIRMRFDDFKRLVNPVIAPLGMPLSV
ncbi:YbaK/EbsC family protein [Planctomycetales bacterium ZRK34]|nr:YbaK/EbsC family protein [Planctomycetales bacterium ZRK34]